MGRAQRRVEYVPLHELVANPRNPKDHDLALLRRSVDRFGYVETITRDDRTGQIISGHGRAETLALMREAGEAPPDGIGTDEEGNWLVPVAVGWRSRTDAEASAALIALNRTSEVGGWVDESLLELLDELAEAEGGFEGLGYDGDDIEVLRRRIAALGTTDPVAEWEAAGRDWEQTTRDEYKRINVLFRSEDDYQSFLAELGMTEIQGGKGFWYPYSPNENAHEAYVVE